MKVNSRIQSFTLQETLVVLMLTAILIGLVFYAFRFVQNDTNHLQARAKYVNEMELFSQALQADLDNPIKVKVIKNVLTIENSGVHEKILWTSELNSVKRVSSDKEVEVAEFPLNVRFGSVFMDMENPVPMGNLVVYISPFIKDTLLLPRFSHSDFAIDSLYFTVLLSSEMVIKKDTISLVKNDPWQ